MKNSTTETRIHGLDVLRGVAMVLGIVLHGTISYKEGYHYGEWPFDPMHKSYFYDWLYLLINSFRMQLFFLLAGFFANLLITKRGVFSFGENRFKRVVLPFLVSYFTILPLTLIPYLYVQYEKAGDPWPQIVSFFTGFFSLRQTSGFMHLWFLQHLIIFYVGTGVVIALSRRAGIALVLPMERIGGKLIYVMIAVIIVLSQLFPAPLPSIWTGFITPLPQLLYYAAFFYFGWLLQSSRSTLAGAIVNYKLLLVLGTGLSVLVVFLLNSFASLPLYSTEHMLLKTLFAIQTVCLVFGFIGLFLGLFKAEKPFWKYVAESAYWVYLVHLPLVMGAQLLLIHTSVPATFRFPVVIISGFVLSMLSYHLLVRNTWVGVFLNGKRISSTVQARTKTGLV